MAKSHGGDNTSESEEYESEERDEYESEERDDQLAVIVFFFLVFTWNI
jgi:hypothetical protein